jgi:uncharacterized metal-binding protein YceD (DUF177 family)
MTEGDVTRPTSPALWTRRVPAARFGPKPALLSLEAEDAERKAIAKAYGCISVDVLAADLKINRRGDELRATGELRADVVQPCVVTLEPVAARIREQVQFSFAPVTAPRREAREEEAEEIAYEGEDPPEPMVDGEADLGAVLLQFFALALDPYPRRAGVALADPPDEDKTHPFDALKRLKSDV